MMRLKTQRVIVGQIRDLRQSVHVRKRRPYPARARIDDPRPKQCLKQLTVVAVPLGQLACARVGVYRLL
jgi:hypothetical protein